MQAVAISIEVSPQPAKTRRGASAIEGNKRAYPVKGSAIRLPASPLKAGVTLCAVPTPSPLVGLARRAAATTLAARSRHSPCRHLAFCLSPCRRLAAVSEFFYRFAARFSSTVVTSGSELLLVPLTCRLPPAAQSSKPKGLASPFFAIPNGKYAVHCRSLAEA
ncbi:O-phosphoserine--tRNA(Cys) ligase [Striga asiatica]|uniref:O-phosphoserine--tRNA(Cys) ligase n=1 Tax=Striga asiatica TaxID=4170 RepID=A0A5A7R217_STRAF|nr:O-phosphoserine--tRNA(Cys) ligase [Striga asiatica]